MPRDLPPARVERRRCAPLTYPCPRCGTPGRRKGLHTRTARCLAYRQILFLELTTAEYRAACTCCKTFRSHVAGVAPRAAYSDRVRDAVLDRLLDDRMSGEALRRSLARDFYLHLSDGFVYDCLASKVRQVNGADYRRWTLERFSGTLCVDEVRLGRRTLLLATDPLGDFPVAFALVSKNDHAHMRRFLGNLKGGGFLPRVVVTDGSGLYPALLAELWPQARHQLCVFHVLQDVNDKVLGAVKRLRRQEARRGRGRRRRQPGRPRKGANKRRGPTAQDQAHFVFKRRHLIVKRRANLTGKEKEELATMLGYLPALRRLRQFVDRIHRLFEAGQSAHQAWCRRAALLREGAFRAVPELAEAMALLSAERFAKMVAFAHSPAGQRVRTNNHVERVNRQLRYLEKVRYKWRRRRTLVRFVVLTLERWRQRGARPHQATTAQEQPAAEPSAPPDTVRSAA
jgi:transposase